MQRDGDDAYAVGRAAEALDQLGVPLPESATHEEVVVALDRAIAEREITLLDSASRKLRPKLTEYATLQDLRASISAEHLHHRLLVFGRVQEALTRLREVGSTDGMIARAPKEVASACDMDRVVIYRIEKQMLVAEAFHVAGDPSTAADLLEFSRANPALLSEQMLEREMLRR